MRYHGPDVGIRAVATVALLLLVLSACAGDDRVSSTSTTTPPTQAVVSEGRPVSTVPPTTGPPTTTPPPTTTIAPSTTTPPSKVPPTTTTTQPPRGRLVVNGTGDVNLDPSYIPNVAIDDWSFPWAGVGEVLTTDDLTVVNLECAASDLGTPGTKEFIFRCSTAALPAMRAGGVEVANLGNNHSGDFGKEALVDSRRTLGTAGIAPVGVGIDATQAHEPALLEINGWRVAVLGFGGVFPDPTWFATDDRPGMADGDTIETMVAAVEAADAVADLVIVSIHWGVELDTQPRPEDRKRAEAMIAAGADAIFGHHSHRLQPLETVDGVPVAWGLGNFVWPTFSTIGSTTAIATVIFEPDGSVSSCLQPVFIATAGQPVLQQPYDPAAPCG